LRVRDSVASEGCGAVWDAGRRYGPVDSRLGVD